MTQPVRAGVASLVVQDSRYLLMLLRHGKHGAGTWSLPGGWMEFGESFFDTAVREVKEETGVDVQGSRVRGVTNDIFSDHGIHAITVFVETNYIGGEPTVMEPDKCPLVEWVDLRNVRHLPLFDPLKRWIEADGFITGFGLL